MAQSVVSRLDFGYLVDMFHADSPDPVVPWASSALLQTSDLFQEVRDRRRLGHERERPVGLDRNERGRGHAGLDVGRARVELLAKVHGLDTACAERGADGRAGRRLARRHDEADYLRPCSQCLRHFSGKETTTVLCRTRRLPNDSLPGAPCRPHGTIGQPVLRQQRHCRCTGLSTVPSNPGS